jgi:hypothetical protein
MIDTKRLMNPDRSAAEAPTEGERYVAVANLLQILVRINPVYALKGQDFPFVVPCKKSSIPITLPSDRTSIVRQARSKYFNARSS